MTTHGPDQQAQLYRRGVMGADPGLPVAFEEWEALASEALKAGPYGYVAGGAGVESTMSANLASFQHWALVPRVLRTPTDRVLKRKILGADFAAPFAPAPVGVLGIIHDEAELAPARSAARAGVPFILSTVSSIALEPVASAMGDATRWFQLYPLGDRAIMASLVRRAEAAGYSAIVLTVDTPLLGWRPRDLRTGYLPFLQGQGIANFVTDPVFRSQLEQSPHEAPAEMILAFLTLISNVDFAWDGLDAVRAMTDLPLIVKGVLHPDDAREAVERGADGIVVSNHGGRQVDGAIAALDALPGVYQALSDRVPILFDSGIRSGSDVLKALALGASAALVGRPYVYALAVAGESGVDHLFQSLMGEIDTLMALCGARTLDDLDHALIIRTA